MTGLDVSHVGQSHGSRWVSEANGWLEPKG
ncbi:hypothetical protein J2Z50_006375 [Ensifer mexicanus]|nr:hypothetical protein [Sinorhizobium mexicanum]